MRFLSFFAEFCSEHKIIAVLFFLAVFLLADAVKSMIKEKIKGK